jgi:hypothetical protein
LGAGISQADIATHGMANEEKILQGEPVYQLRQVSDIRVKMVLRRFRAPTVAVSTITE